MGVEVEISKRIKPGFSMYRVNIPALTFPFASIALLNKVQQLSSRFQLHLPLKITAPAQQVSLHTEGLSAPYRHAECIAVLGNKTIGDTHVGPDLVYYPPLFGREKIGGFPIAGMVTLAKVDRSFVSKRKTIGPGAEHFPHRFNLPLPQQAEYRVVKNNLRVITCAHGRDVESLKGLVEALNQRPVWMVKIHDVFFRTMTRIAAS